MKEVKCWCCWETSNTAPNSLIRACLKCKDADLQYVHQECMDKYLRLFVTAKYRIKSSIRKQEFQIILDHYINYRTFIEINAANEGSEIPFTRNNCSFNENEYILKNREFRCTRCLDEYLIIIKEVDPKMVLKSDKILSSLTIILTGCILILTVSCFNIIVTYNQISGEARGRGFTEEKIREMLFIKPWFLSFPMDIRNMAFTIILFFLTCYVFTMYAVIHFLKGFYELKTKCKLSEVVEKEYDNSIKSI